jgi:hypothetical protein
MSFASRDLTVTLFASPDCGCTKTPEPICGCTKTPDPICGCTKTPDAKCGEHTAEPGCTPTPGGGDKPKQALGVLRQQLREALIQTQAP